MGLFQSKPAAGPGNKVRCNVSNAKEIKIHCDDTIEQILTQPPKASSPDAKDLYLADFKPFTASHFMDDMLMFLDLVGSAVMLGATAYVYLKKVAWEEAKPIFIMSTGIFFSLFAICTVISYIRGHVVFTGVRMTESQPGELECILIKSPYTHKAVLSDEKTKEGKRVLIPPVYELQVEYMRLGSDNRTVCARKKGCVIVGNFVGQNMSGLQARNWGGINNQPVSLFYVCKCTCFTTNTTLVPILWPKDGQNICSTCTKELCVERAEGCRGAQIVEPNSDTATGYEGQVWAKCFVRDPTKDQSIVFLYLVCVLALLFWALIRSHYGRALLGRIRDRLRR